MFRVLIAAAAANAAAPLLFALAVGAGMTLDDPDFPRNLGAQLWITFVILWLSACAVASTTLPASLLFALAGFHQRWRSPWIYLAGGAAIGFGFVLWHWGFTPHLLRRAFPYWIVTIGLACAWLYWLMARGALAKTRRV